MREAERSLVYVIHFMVEEGTSTLDLAESLLSAMYSYNDHKNYSTNMPRYG